MTNTKKITYRIEKANLGEASDMVTLTLSGILRKLGYPKWDEWCNAKGWSYWVCAEGGGDTEVSMTIDEAKEWGIIQPASVEETDIEGGYTE